MLYADNSVLSIPDNSRGSEFPEPALSPSSLPLAAIFGYTAQGSQFATGPE